MWGYPVLLFFDPRQQLPARSQVETIVVFGFWQFRAADLSRFETVFFPLPGLFPLRPGILSVSGILVRFRGIFSVSAGIFFRFGKRYFSRIGMDFFRFEKELFPRRKVFFTFPTVFPLPKGFFPTAKRYFFCFGAECDKAARKTEHKKARKQDRKPRSNSNAKQASETTNTSKNTQTDERARKEEATRNQPINASNLTNQAADVLRNQATLFARRTYVKC